MVVVHELKEHKTPFYDKHVKAGGHMVLFAGWLMPLHYGSQLKEHEIVRQSAGMFDVSHMAVLDLKGLEVKTFLQKLLANDVAKLSDGHALYSCMLNEKGGIIDDLIVYRFSDTHYRLVVNAGTADKDLRWVARVSHDFDCAIQLRRDLGLLAVQGPKARELLLQVCKEDSTALSTLKPFHMSETPKWVIACTGYTGEDGFEIMASSELISKLWDNLISVGVQPCGLGARDTLRLEAGMDLYGIDMNEETTPYESNLAWTVDLKDLSRDFIGKQALLTQKEKGIPNQLVGLVFEGAGILRGGMSVRLDNQETCLGTITSGSYSPFLKHSIALARIPKKDFTLCEVQLRGQWRPVRVVKPPFVRSGKSLVSSNI